MDKTPSPQPPAPEAESTSLLPRSAWSSELAHLRALLKAKQALDQQDRDQPV